MNTFQDLETFTAIFFDRHWPHDDFNELRPTWIVWKPFLHGPVPNHKFAGCYALFKDNELVYIGHGASRGGGRYEHHGIGRRVMAHIIASDKQRGAEWSKLRERWIDINGFYSIALPHTLAYLSSSLETYLIRTLPTDRNRNV